MRLRVECILYCNLQSRARTHAVLAIGLYELLDPTTQVSTRAPYQIYHTTTHLMFLTFYQLLSIIVLKI